MSRPAPAAPGPARSWSRRLLTTDDHPRHAITDPAVRRRYQRRRLVVAAVGGMLGGLGLGLTYSHGGLLAADVMWAAIGPLLLGVALAAAFVWFPLPRLVRWLAVVGLVVVSVALMDVALDWQIGLGLVGLVLSWVLAVLLQYLLGVVRIVTAELPARLAGLALLAALVVGGPAPALAQADDRSCGPGRLEVVLDGRAGVFTAGGDGEAFRVDVDPGSTSSRSRWRRSRTWSGARSWWS